MKLSGLAKLFLRVVLALLFVGCASMHVDWNGRIGTYTYDQAVTELGPPDKQARLTDGERVAEWITRYYGSSTTIITPGSYAPGGGVGYVQTIGPRTYESSLRLTFSTNNILTKWLKN